MKTAIVYYSNHHGNTKKLVEAIAAADPDVTLIDVQNPKTTNLTPFNRIGLASGIYRSSFHKTMEEFARTHVPKGKNVFLLYTFGTPRQKYTMSMREILYPKGCTILGEYGCPGFDSHSLNRLMGGGLSKGHPDEEDLELARLFYRDLQ